MKLIKKEPALAAALLSVLGAILGIWVKNPELVGALVGAAAVLMGVRQVVVPVTTVVEHVTTAATNAATETAKNLGSDTVGAVGYVTKAATEIVNNTVDKTVGNLFSK